MHAVHPRQQPSFNCFEFRWKVHTCMEMLERKVDNKKVTTDTRAGSFEQNESNYTFWTCSYKYLTYLAEKPSLICENINIILRSLLQAA